MMGNLCDHWWPLFFFALGGWFQKKRGHNWRISLKMYRFTGDYPSPRTWNPIFHSIPPVIVNIDHQLPADCDIKCTFVWRMGIPINHPVASGMTGQLFIALGTDNPFHAQAQKQKARNYLVMRGATPWFFQRCGVRLNPVPYRTPKTS